MMGIETPATIKQLIFKMAEDGHSASEIAVFVTGIGHKVSRSAVLGICFRGGVKIGETRRRAVQEALDRSRVERSAPSVQPREPSGKCRYPHGDPRKRGFHFCEQPVFRASASYCQKHQDACYHRYAPQSEEANEARRLAQLRRFHGGAAQGHDEERR